MNSEENNDTSGLRSDGIEDLYAMLESAASTHIKEMQALVEEKNASKTRLKKRHLEKKIDKKKLLIYDYMVEMEKVNNMRSTAVEADE